MEKARVVKAGQVILVLEAVTWELLLEALASDWLAGIDYDIIALGEGEGK